MESKVIMKSLQIPEGAPSLSVITKACQHMKDQKDFKAIRDNKTKWERLNHSSFDFEIIQTLNNVRINLYNATDADVFWLGVNYQNAYSGKL